jgi:hypothetical protein
MILARSVVLTKSKFALKEDRPLFAFAGIWTTFKGYGGTKSEPIPGPHLVYGFLTTQPNAVVAPIHPKAMPVILTSHDDYDTWMRAPCGEASALQPPLSDTALQIVMRGAEKEDRVAAQGEMSRVRHESLHSANLRRGFPVPRSISTTRSFLRKAPNPTGTPVSANTPQGSTLCAGCRARQK